MTTENKAAKKDNPEAAAETQTKVREADKWPKTAPSQKPTADYETVEMPKGLFEVLKNTFENLPAGAMPGTVAQVANLLAAIQVCKVV